MKSIIVLIGPPGSGKGTQASILVEKFGWNTISTGLLIRGEIKSGSEVGKKVKSIIKNGDLIGDDLMFLMLKNKLMSIDMEKIIIDGFPRSIEQVQMYDEWTNSDGKDYFLKKVFVLDVDEKEIIKRIENRVVCPDCGATFNLYTKKPIIEGICDVCGQKITSRSDDINADIVKHRYELYKKESKDIIDFYNKKNLTIKIDALKNIKDVNSDIVSTLINNEEV
jgi:adenylate kinase